MAGENGLNAGAVTRLSWLVSSCYFAGALALAGCGAIGGGAGITTIDGELTMAAAESEMIGVAASAEQVMVLETIAAAGTRIADMAAVNAALGATLRAHQTGTPEVRPVVVSADDMGSSLEGDMMAEAEERGPPDTSMRLSNLSSAASRDPDTGCSTGTVNRFSASAESIYIIAQVAALQIDVLFEVDWRFNGRSIYRPAWLADFSGSSVCIWFYATPVDFPFLPGNYTATLYADGLALGTTEFDIGSG